MGSDANGRSQQRHEDWMRQAIELATANVRTGGGPFGAVITMRDELVATGQNQVATSNDPTAHAEVVAIRNACAQLGSFSLEGCTLYSSCEPCPMCMGAILWAHCDALYFGNTAKDADAAGFADAQYYQEIRKSNGKRRLTTKNLLRDEAGASFKAWALLSERIIY